VRTPTKEQFSGCLIGQCLGDALGFIVEGYPPDVCQQYVEQEVRTGGVKRRQRGPLPFGQYSDDSQLGRELLQSYRACGRFDPADYAQRIAAIFVENRIVGRGLATEAAALRLAAGVPWQQAGTPAPSAGNGSAMRAGPIGLLFFDDPQRLVEAAHDQGRITHQDPRCSAGAVAIAGAVALALQDESLRPNEFVGQLAPLVRGHDATFAGYVDQLPEWIRLTPAEAVLFIRRAGIDPAELMGAEDWEGVSPFVVGSVLWSLYAFLRTPDDYFETICTAVAVGGDVDTTAAMAGAISGAHLGVDAVPADLAEYLTDQGTWGLTELKSLANECHQLKASAGPSA
jgi:ADP-ribosylglycohydrolase